MKKLNCILLIDDNLASNAFHIITLKRSNACECIKTATSGRQALEMLIGAPAQAAPFSLPELIYLDINMPGMNGFEFLDEYKRLKAEHCPAPVIIILSSSSNPDDHKRARGYQEIADYQNKPLTVEAVHQAIKKYFTSA